MKDKEFHIGKLIKAKLQEEERSEAWLARKVHCNPGNFNRILRKQSIDMDLLKRISEAMNFNFCRIYSEYVQENIDENGEELK